MSDTDIDYSDNEIEDNDDKIEENEEDRHEDKDEELQLAKQYGREGKYHALVGGALNAAALNDNLVTSKPDDHTPNNAGVGQSLPANVKTEKARGQRQRNVAASLGSGGRCLRKDQEARAGGIDLRRLVANTA